MKFGVCGWLQNKFNYWYEFCIILSKEILSKQCSIKLLIKELLKTLIMSLYSCLLSSSYSSWIFDWTN